MSPGAAEAPRRKAEALLPVTSVGDQALEVRSPQHRGHLSQMAHAPGDRIVLERRGYEAQDAQRLEYTHSGKQETLS